LEETEGRPLAVYAVWFEMFGSDSESRWPSDLLTDPRVTHFWDAEKVVGTWYGEHVTAKSSGHVEWDAWFLYDAGATWDDGPAPLIDWGRTIVATRDELRRRSFERLGEPE
jgi:hypothetical protein